jgi:hypothetical protein
LKEIKLVFHQGDQRRDHDGQAIELKSRQLIAEAFSGTCGKYRQHRFSFEQPGDDFLLTFTQPIESESRAQQLHGGGGQKHGRLLRSLPVANGRKAPGHRSL